LATGMRLGRREREREIIRNDKLSRKLYCVFAPAIERELITCIESSLYIGNNYLHRKTYWNGTVAPHATPIFGPASDRLPNLYEGVNPFGWAQPIMHSGTLLYSKTAARCAKETPNPKPPLPLPQRGSSSGAQRQVR
jgi:hypothetical protein